MIPATLDELIAVRDECYAMVSKRAFLSGGGAAVPLPGTDVALDVAILMQLIPAINKQFGLSEDQIADYDPAMKQMLYQVIKRAGLALVGQELTKTLVTQILKKVAGRVAVKQLMKFVPFIGQVVNVGIGYTAMRYVGRSHVDDCFDVCKKASQASKAR